MVTAASPVLRASCVEAANAEAFDRLDAADPWVVDVAPAREAIPGYGENLVLTSGAPMAWEAYVGGQREALIGGALFEGLARTRQEAIDGFASGDISIGACHDYGAVGSLAGIYTASMPVFVVENRAHGNIGYCNFYEARSRAASTTAVTTKASTSGSSTSTRCLRQSWGRRSGGPVVWRSNH